MTYRKVTDHTGILDFGYAGVPFYFLNGKEIVLFDSGMEELPQIFQMLDEDGIRVSAVIHTHLHRDHLANNPIIYRKYHAPFFADAKEIAFAQESHLEGKDPNYLEFDPSHYTPFEEGQTELECGGTVFRLFPTPGHSAGHTSFITPDNIMIVGDCFVSQRVLDSSKIPFMMDIEHGIASMLKIADTDCSYYIPAHKWEVPKAQLKDLIFNNISVEGRLALLVTDLVTEPMTLFEVQKNMFEKLQLTHLKDIEWIRYMVTKHIEKAVARKMILEKDGKLQPIY